MVSRIKKLLRINRTTGIETRSAIMDYRTGWASENKPPSIEDMNAIFRTAGVTLTVQACEKAVDDWGGQLEDITHTVAVTCTNQGNPGFDLLVNKQLDLSPSVDCTLLHGVGCAGGLAIMRTAAQLACGATMRGRPARILCFACELSTPNIRYEVDAAAKCLDASQICIAGALFSDAAAAFVLCNDMGLQKCVKPVFELLDWDNTLVPDTSRDLEFFVEATGTESETGVIPIIQYRHATGYRTRLSKTLPRHAVAAVDKMVHSLLPSIRNRTPCKDLGAADCDWALHPGGQAIIDGVQQAMGLVDEQLRATRDIYRTRGNSSSPTVLAVLDRLRCMGTGKKFVIATAFGPGLSAEMSFLRSCSVSSTCH